MRLFFIVGITISVLGLTGCDKEDVDSFIETLDTVVKTIEEAQ